MIKLVQKGPLSSFVVRLHGLQPAVLPLKTPHCWRTSAHLSPCQTNNFTTPLSRTNNNMAKAESSKPSPPQAPPRWQQISWQKKDEQYARIPNDWRLPSKPSPDVTNYMQIPRECGILSQEELSITQDYDATALAEAIRSRKLRCIDVTRAFCKVGRMPSAINTIY